MLTNIIGLSWAFAEKLNLALRRRIRNERRKSQTIDQAAQ